MKRKFYKKIRSEKTADGLNRLSLLSVYSNNCSEQNYVDVNDETLEGLKSLARYQRRQDSKDYRNLSIYAYDCLTDTTASVEDEYVAKLESARLRNALMLLKPIIRRRFIRRYLLGMSCEKIGQLDGVSRAAVSLSIKNARILLKKHLGEEYINDK